MALNLNNSAASMFAKVPLSLDAPTAAPNLQEMTTESLAKSQELADKATTSQAGLANAQTQAAVQQNAAQGQYAQKEADYMLAGARKAEAAQEPVPDKFAPTQENHNDMVALFSMIGAIGAMGGGKSYGSALGAMQAMGGMLQGYTKGRQDLFEREKVEFDKNLQAVKAHNDQINAAFDRYMKMAPANLTSAKNELNNKLVSIGANLQAKQVEMSGAQKAFENQLKVNQELQKTMTAAQRLTGTGGSGTVNVIGPDGKPIVVTKQQAAQAAQEGKPYTPAASGGARSLLAQSFEDQVTMSVNEAAQQIKNLAFSPFSTTGIFGGVKRPEGLLSAPIGALANTLTPGSVQQYNKNIQGLGYELAKVLGGGRVVAVSTQKQFSDQFEIKTGDKPFTILETLANMRQKFERAAEVKMVSPSTTPEMKEIYKSAIDGITKKIPFTVQDVLEAQQAEAKNKGKKLPTFGEFMQSKMGSKPLAPDESANKQTTSDGWTLEGP